MKSPSHLPYILAPVVTIESRLSCGSSSVLRVGRARKERADWSEHILKAPLAQRAWVCQERVSSPRILHYTSTQMFWECEHLTLSQEDSIVTHAGIVAPDGGARRLFLSLHRSLIPKEWNEPLYDPMMQRYNHPLSDWYHALIANNYSRCNLTFKRDKLDAISGLAKLIFDQTSVPYFAGHWFYSESYFLESLCWVRTSTGAKSIEYRAPSWSWASQDSAIKFFFVAHSTTVKLSQIVHLYTEPKPPSSSPFGSLSSGKMVVEGPLLLLKLRHIPYTYYSRAYWNASDRDNGYHYLDDDTEPLGDTLCYALPLTSRDSSSLGDDEDGRPWKRVHFLILVEAEHGTRTMRRIGFGMVGTVLDWAQQLLQAPVTRLRII
jgi:hypothetical protein